MRINHQNPIVEDKNEFGKVGAETSYLQSQMHTDCVSAESIADSDLEDGELRKKSWRHHCIDKIEDCSPSRLPTAPGKPAAMIQERGASVKRTQADYSRRESLMSCSSQEPRATGKPAAMFHEEARNLEINSRVLACGRADKSKQNANCENTIGHFQKTHVFDCASILNMSSSISSKHFPLYEIEHQCVASRHYS